MYFFAYRAWHRSRNSPWQHAVRIRLVPVTVGLVVGGGTVMARTADIGWMAAGVTVATAMLMLRTRLNPMLMLAAGGLAGGLGLLG